MSTSLSQLGVTAIVDRLTAATAAHRDPVAPEGLRP